MVFCIGSAVPLLAKKSAEPFVLAMACKNGAPQLCWRCIGGRHSYVYAVLAGSNSVPVSSVLLVLCQPKFAGFVVALLLVRDPV